MTFGRTGTGINNSIPEVRELEGNGKKTFPKLGNGKGMKKSISTFRERESGAIIPGNTQEREREWQEKTKYYDNKRYLENMWQEKDFSPHVFSITPSSIFPSTGHKEALRDAIF